MRRSQLKVSHKDIKLAHKTKHFSGDFIKKEELSLIASSYASQPSLISEKQ